MTDEIQEQLNKMRKEWGEEYFQEHCREMLRFNLQMEIEVYQQASGVTKREALFVAHHEMIEAIKHMIPA